MAATIASRIQDLIGSDMSASVVTSYEDIIRDSFNYIADLIPADSELWLSRFLENDTLTASYRAHDKKILIVTSQSEGSTDTRTVREVTFDEFLKAEDTRSIFYAGGTRNPVYTIHPNTNYIDVANRVSSSTYIVYFFEYFSQDISTLTTFESISEGTSGRGFPESAIHLSCIKSSIALLNARISEAAQDDEDAELVQILQSQLGVLDKAYQDEMQRLALPYKAMGVENETA
tara:strand:- start:1286 stop:1981 length:696 start_codon:yes stop_codon:yes gene_type:complete